jgi:hypothetical protein
MSPNVSCWTTSGELLGSCLCDSLSQAQYDKHGKFSPATFKKRFLTWNKALSAAGLLLGKRAHVPSGEMLADLRRVATIAGGSTLTRGEYAQHGLFSAATISKRFGTWEKCLKLLGLEPGWAAASTEELLDNLESVWRHLWKAADRRRNGFAAFKVQRCNLQSPVRRLSEGA